MRLRRVEFLVILLTLAFACFMGGYLMGRSIGSVSISPVVQTQTDIVQATVSGESAGVPQGNNASASGAAGSGTTASLSETSDQQVSTENSKTGGVNQNAGEPTQTPNQFQSHAQGESQALEPPPMQSYDAFGRININTASRSELMDLPGIGSSLSERIVDYRNTHGSFRTIEDLRRVSGIGEKRFEAIMNRITVG